MVKFDILVFVFLSLANASGPSDVCSYMDQQFGLNGGSYVKGTVCHGLFWTSSAKNNVCFYNVATKDSCPTGLSVTVIEAEAWVRARTVSSSSTTSSSTTDSPSTRSGQFVPSMPRSIDSMSTMIPTSTSSTSTSPITSLSPVIRRVSFLAFGDWGLNSESLTATMNKIEAKFFFAQPDYLSGVFLLGDNFYPRGIRRELSLRDPQFNLFSGTIATNAPPGLVFYPVLGNHDWMGDTDAQIAYSRFHPRWVMPALYYMHKFASDSVCAWFIDTESFFSDMTQQRWLRDSLASSSACVWKIVNGHYPVFTGGEYTSCGTLDRFRAAILPILNEYRVDLYVSGHEHQSQILKQEDHNTVYVVAGAVADMRGNRVRGNPHLRWIDSRTIAFAEIQASSDDLRVVFHRSYGGIDAEPLCSATLTRPTSSGSVVLTLSECDM